jgi:hypothetical protein
MQCGLCRHDRGTQDLGEPARVRGGRGGQHPQVRPQGGAYLDQEGQRQVGVQVAFVAFVDHHHRGTGEFRIALQAADQDAGGDHLDDGPRRDLAVAADGVADPLADPLVQQVGHAPGRGAGRDPAGFRHHHPSGAGQGQRYQGGLAGAGRRDQHRRARPRQRGRHRRQHRADRQVGQGLRVDQHRISLAHRRCRAVGACREYRSAANW